MNKPKLNQPDVELTTTFNGMDIPESLNVNVTIPSDMLKDFINQQSILEEYNVTPEILREVLLTGQMFRNQLTFDECIKELEDKGFIIENDEFYMFLHHEQYSINMVIDKKEIKYHTYFGYISLELNELLTKTLRALEEMKDD